MNYIKDRIRGIFQLSDPPHKLAAAFAVGIFIAFTPTFGLHVISCLILAWLFRLSKLVMITAAFLNNPWTVVPMYGFCLWFGMKITGTHITVPNIAWKELGIMDLFHLLKPYLWPFVAGTLVLGVIAAVISYFVIYSAAVRYRKGK